jgi:uncharacterized protein YprB with RNaseH-like and TPR domain
MIKTSPEKLKNVAEYAIVHGLEKAALNFSMKQESVSRYIREAKIKKLIGEDEEAFMKKPNVLIFDIETAPAKAYVYRIWKENIPIDFISAPWFMLSWSAKWLYEHETFSDAVTPEEAVKEDDRRIAGSLWKHIDVADIIIGHNIKMFDTRKMNTRFIIHGMKPTSPYQQIDTLEIVKKNFAFESNKLDYVARMLGVKRKMDSGGAQTWVDCSLGDPESLKLMEEYNVGDIETTEEVYVKLRPWVKSHPNMALYFDDVTDRCPNCGSKNLHCDKDKFYYTPMNRYSTVKCLDCGGVGRSRTSSLTSNERQGLNSTTAR